MLTQFHGVAANDSFECAKESIVGIDTQLIEYQSHFDPVVHDDHEFEFTIAGIGANHVAQSCPDFRLSLISSNS